MSYKKSEYIIRCREVCEGAVLDIINERISNIADQYKSEFDRILTLIAQNPTTLSINSLEVVSHNFSINRDVLDKVKTSLQQIKKIDLLLLRLKAYRYIFFSLIILTGIEIVIKHFWGSIPILIPSIFLIFSAVAFLLAFLYDSVVSHTLFQKIRLDYGLSI